MSIYRHELRSYLKSTLTWIVCIGLVTLFFFSIYPVFRGSVESIHKILQALPPDILQALGMAMESLATVNGYFSFLLTYIVLCGAIQAMNTGLSVLSKETSWKTADFLLTKPVTRAGILTSKLLALLTCLGVTSAFFMAAAIGSARLFSQEAFDLPPFLLMALSFFFVQVIFASMGFFVASVIPRIKSVIPVSLGIVFGFFILGMVGAALKLEEINFLSPFRYFDPMGILEHSAYTMPYPVVGVFVVAAAVALSYAVYLKKDIHAT